jgi:hypothetical protein
VIQVVCDTCGVPAVCGVQAGPYERDWPRIKEPWNSQPSDPLAVFARLPEGWVQEPVWTRTREQRDYVTAIKNKCSVCLWKENHFKGPT